MKTALVCLAVLVAATAVAAEVAQPEWEEPEYLTKDGDFYTALLETGYSEPNLGYVATSSAFDNPSDLSTPTPAIPSSPDCTVRPQTIVEIHRMRRSATRIASMIQTEASIMQKRKAYIEQMTSYLNDRIRELNKVKGELAQENRWIEMSNKRIQELANKEKLIKMQDILSCLNADQERLQGNKQSQVKQITSLGSQAKSIETQISTIQAEMKALADGKTAATAGAVESL